MILSRLLVVAACAAAGGCAQPVEPTAPRPTRSVAFDSCPKVRLAPLPSGFELVRRRLESIGGNRMGEVVTYRRDSEVIQAYSGPDLYDRLEDLDLVAKPVQTERYLFSVSTTTLAPELSIAVLDEKHLEGATCTDAGVVTRHVPREEVPGVLESFTVAAPD